MAPFIGTTSQDSISLVKFAQDTLLEIEFKFSEGLTLGEEPQAEPDESMYYQRSP